MPASWAFAVLALGIAIVIKQRCRLPAAQKEHKAQVAHEKKVKRMHAQIQAPLRPATLVKGVKWRVWYK